MGQIFVRASRRAKAHYRSGRHKSKKNKSVLWKMHQVRTTHAYELEGRGSTKVLMRWERKMRRLVPILAAKRARGSRVSAYR